MYAVDHTFGHRNKKFICACAKLPVQRTVPNSEAESLNIVNFHRMSDTQVCKWMSGSDPRTGMFHQMRPTAEDTAGSVKGV